MKRKKYIAVIVVALVPVWFLGVDWSWFVHECPDCGYSKDVAQYRFFTIALHQTTYGYPTIAQRVAIDLDIPCQHENSTTWHKHRWWGLLVCKCPCINGLYGLNGDDSWYDLGASAKVTALGKADKSIKHDFAQSVFEDHDFTFVRTVLNRAGVATDPPEERIPE